MQQTVILKGDSQFQCRIVEFPAPPRRGEVNVGSWFSSLMTTKVMTFDVKENLCEKSPQQAFLV